jgi:hypothetical protein
MAEPVPAIHILTSPEEERAWMPVTSTGMTVFLD